MSRALLSTTQSKERRREAQSSNLVYTHVGDCREPLGLPLRLLLLSGRDVGGRHDAGVTARTRRESALAPIWHLCQPAAGGAPQNGRHHHQGFLRLTNSAPPRWVVSVRPPPLPARARVCGFRRDFTQAGAQRGHKPTVSEVSMKVCAAKPRDEGVHDAAAPLTVRAAALHDRPRRARGVGGARGAARISPPAHPTPGGALLHHEAAPCGQTGQWR